MSNLRSIDAAAVAAPIYAYMLHNRIAFTTGESNEELQNQAVEHAHFLILAAENQGFAKPGEIEHVMDMGSKS